MLVPAQFAKCASIWCIIGLAAPALALSLYVAPLAHFFRFARPPVSLLLAAVAVPLATITVVSLARQP